MYKVLYENLIWDKAVCLMLMGADRKITLNAVWFRVNQNISLVRSSFLKK